MKKLLLSPWLALITLFVMIGVRYENPTFVESVRLRYFDTLITSKKPTENNVYTVNIDEDSLNKYGQWPLPRSEYSYIIQELYKRNAGLVILDVLMPERDRSGEDALLAKTIAKYPVILANIPAEKTKNNPKVPGAVIIGSEFEDTIVKYPGLIANVPELETNAVGVGSVNTMPEIDGVNRRAPLVSTVDGKIYPSLAMEVLRVAAGDSTVQIKLNENGVEKMRIPSFGPITTDSLGRVWIDWSQKGKQVSLANLPEDFNSAMVIVGPTAAGIANPLSTPVGATYPQDVQASLIYTMMNGVVISRPD